MASTRAEGTKDVQQYWSFGYEAAVIDGIVIKGRLIVIPESLLKGALDQLHVNHMGIGKARLLACESIYQTTINTDIETAIKIAMCALIFRQHNQKIRCCHMRYQADHGNALD